MDFTPDCPYVYYLSQVSSIYLQIKLKTTYSRYNQVGRVYPDLSQFILIHCNISCTQVAGAYLTCMIENSFMKTTYPRHTQVGSAYPDLTLFNPIYPYSS